MKPRYPFTSTPRGWYAVLAADELSPGTVQTVTLAGNEYAVFRTEAGAVHGVDAFCPHLGANLGKGRVQGDEVVCPFHGWRFGSDGKCAHIPDLARIPSKAKVDVAPVKEIGPLIFMWFDPEGRAPTWSPPEAPGGAWTKPLTREYRFRGHPMDVYENAIDAAHLSQLHGWSNAALRAPIDQEGPLFNVALRFDVDGDTFGMPGMTNEVEVDAEAWGLGFMTQTFRVKNLDVDTLMYFAPTPLGDDQVVLRVSLMLQVLEDDPGMSDELVTLMGEAIHKTVLEDVEIFQNKRHLERPLLVKGDKPISTFRAWARQFYVLNARGDIYRDDALPAVVDRVQTWLRSRLRRGSATPGEAAATPRSRFRSRVAKPASQRPRPAAVTSVNEYRETLPARFVPDAAQGVKMVIQWDLKGPEGGLFHAQIMDGDIEVCEGPHDAPDVAVAVEATSFLQVANGEASGARVFTRRGSVTGDMRMVMRLGSIFPSARPSDRNPSSKEA